MEKIWLKSYPPDVPAGIDTGELSSLGQLIEEMFIAHAQRTAYVQMGQELTFTQLDARSSAFGAWLQAAGLVRGDRVAIMLPNCLQYPIALFGALRAGFTVVNTNPLYTAPELEHQLADSGATAIVVLENFAHVVQQVLPRTQVRRVIVTAIGDFLSPLKSTLVNFVVRHVRKQVPSWKIDGALDLRAVLAEGVDKTLVEARLTADDVAFLQYTGGTTGVAKGAMLTHGNICANLLQAAAWVKPFLPTVEAGPQYVVTPLPLYHIFALTVNGLVFARLGWTNILVANPRDLKSLIADLKRYSCSALTGVNTLFNAMLNAPDFGSIDFSRLKLALGGGMAVQEEVARRWKQATGVPLTQAWGLTETSPGVCVSVPQTDFDGAVGLPLPSTEVCIRDDEGRELPVGAVGEICARGPQVMRGYWNHPEETAKVMLPEGWLRTGDVGYMNEQGFVYLNDRKKDMILVSGFNVYPNEVEDVVAAHPGVAEVAAVAQKDPHSGEVVAIFVVPKDPTLSTEDLVAWCRKSLTGYKVPRHVYFRTELPKTNVGKILRRALRDSLAG